MTKKYKLGIVIPTFNEAENIVSLLEIVKGVSIQNQIQTKVLVVDDSSPDGTGILVQEFISKYNQKNPYFFVELLSRPKKSGLSSAYIQGFGKLRFEADYCLEMDADHSHRPVYFPMMLEKLESGIADFAIGSRYISGGGVENWGWHRKLISNFGAFYCQKILNVPITDFTGGYNMYKSSIFDTIPLHSVGARGYLFQIELKYRTFRGGFKFVEIPIIFPDRNAGKSKFNKSIVLEAITGVWKLKKIV